MEAIKYGATELAKKARKLFGTTPEAVTAALKTAKLNEATLEEAKKTVKEFLKKEVK